MNKPISIFTLGCLLFMTATAMAAQALFPQPNWARQHAVKAAGQVNITITLKPLFQLARNGNNKELLIELEAIESDSALSGPARDRLLHSFAQALGDLPAWSVSRDVLDYLHNYEAQTLVPHDNRAAVGIALFNIRAAVAGSVSQWQRDTGWMQAQQLLLQQGSEPWLKAYLGAGSRQRAGFLDALSIAPEMRLEEIGGLALKDTSGDSSLALVAARAGILLGDPDLFQRSVAAARGAGLVAALRSATQVFDESETEAILMYSMAHARPEIASLAMAEFTPALLRQPEVTMLMFKTLEDRELGVTAAMLLSASNEPAVRQKLVALAAGRQGLMSRRAALAIGIGKIQVQEDEQ